MARYHVPAHQPLTQLGAGINQGVQQGLANYRQGREDRRRRDHEDRLFQAMQDQQRMGAMERGWQVGERPTTTRTVAFGEPQKLSLLAPERIMPEAFGEQPTLSGPGIPSRLRTFGGWDQEARSEPGFAHSAAAGALMGGFQKPTINMPDRMDVLEPDERFHQGNLAGQTFHRMRPEVAAEDARIAEFQRELLADQQATAEEAHRRQLLGQSRLTAARSLSGREIDDSLVDAFGDNTLARDIFRIATEEPEPPGGFINIRGARFPNTPQGRAEAAALERSLRDAGRSTSDAPQPYRTMNDALNAARRLSEVVDPASGRVIGYDRTPEQLHELAQSLYEGKGMTQLPQQPAVPVAEAPEAAAQQKPSILGAVGRGVMNTLLPSGVRGAAGRAGSRAGERSGAGGVRAPYQDELDDEERIDSLSPELREVFDLYLDDPFEAAIAAVREEGATEDEVAAFEAYWRLHNR